MGGSFSFGIQTGPFDDAAALRTYARKLEDLGYSELFSFDHIGGGEGTLPDPFLPLLVAAEATTTLRFGPLVLNNEFHNPVLLARTAASFDLLSGGRLVLGLGTGYAQDEHDAVGIPLRPPGPRVDRFTESVQVVRDLLDTGSAAFDGDHVAVDVTELGIRPAQPRVPFLIGGHGRRVVTFAAQNADIFQYTGLTHDPVTGAPGPGGFALADVAERYRWIQQANRGNDLTLSTLVQMVEIGDDVEETRRGIIQRLSVTNELIDSTPFFLIGSVAQVIEKLQYLREELGITHVVTREPDKMAPIVAALS